ncbi:E6 [Macaca mulatta papillomavirus 5]|uniref:E6 n=1 Tax=Macaca mulatta papillomavirus 5 TaxID=2364645 RepID=UPI000EB7021F|nr:E6 [Macaca mulatta papillomavirus 5]AYD74598.1 E6 [Macaca mulatta papillomavirus 5]
MEPPSTLQYLCNLCNIRLDQLQIPCVFCKLNLSLFDLHHFSVLNLNLLLRDTVFYGCCRKCLHLSAAYEFYKYYQCSADIEYITVLSSETLGRLQIRCETCMKRLTVTEKYDCVSNKDKCHLVRGIWRAPCRLCRKK